MRSVSAKIPSKDGLKKMEDVQSPTEVTSNCSLGTLVTNFPLSEDEKARINQLIADKGLPREIIVKYCTRTTLFRETWHKVHLPGARHSKGQKALNAQTLKGFLDFLRFAKDREHELCWDIYRECVAMFVDAELNALEKELTDCEWADEEASSHELLREICSKASEFGVKKEDVEKFYECVWLERVDDFGELLKLCSKST
jgi:hypothetical protein